MNLLQSYQNSNPDFRFPDSIPRRCLTKPSQPYHNNGYDNRTHDYILYVSDVLFDNHGNRYTVLDLLGTGTFGQVVKCRHLNTSEIVAVKVIKNEQAYFNQAWVEISILRILHRNRNEEDTKHIVRFKSFFVFRGHLCLVFEKLSINLYEFLKQSNYAGVGLEMLRTFLTQLLQALNVLVRSEIIHCDLKPENILLTNFDTADIKIIDFGSACQAEHPVYSYVQSRFYRSPEILLGLAKYDSKIDMWSLGCVAGELFLGIPLFPGQNEMNMVSRIVEMLGSMSDMFLVRCRNTPRFFNHKSGGQDVRMFELKTTAQYEAENNVKLPEWKRYFRQQKLQDIIMSSPFKTAAPHTEEIALRRSFVDLLGGMLKVDPLERLSPAEAMLHPFIRHGPLPNDQPWVPPGRPRRLPRVRPVPIEIPQDPHGENAMYSSSAPALRGHPLFLQNFQSGADQFPGGPHAEQQPFPGGPHSGYYNALGGAYSATMATGTGSYIPPSTFSQYGFGGTSYDPVHGAYDGTMRTYGRRGGSSSQPHPSDTPPMSSAALPSMSLSIPAGPRRSGQLHCSSSRESLNASLRMSGSRESLGFQRVSSAGDLVDDTMFPFGSDDEGFVPGMPSATGVQLGVPIGRGNPVGNRQGQHVFLPNSGYGYLPPPQSRLPQMGNASQYRGQAAGSTSDVDMGDSSASPGNSGHGGNAYTRKPPQPQQPFDGVQSPRSRNSTSSRGTYS